MLGLPDGIARRRQEATRPAAVDSHARIVNLAALRSETIDQTVRRAVRELRQEALARDLAATPGADEQEWFDADFG